LIAICRERQAELSLLFDAIAIISFAYYAIFFDAASAIISPSFRLCCPCRHFAISSPLSHFRFDFFAFGFDYFSSHAGFHYFAFIRHIDISPLITLFFFDDTCFLAFRHFAITPQIFIIFTLRFH